MSSSSFLHHEFNMNMEQIVISNFQRFLFCFALLLTQLTFHLVDIIYSMYFPVTFENVCDAKYEERLIIHLCYSPAHEAVTVTISFTLIYFQLSFKRDTAPSRPMADNKQPYSNFWQSFPSWPSHSLEGTNEPWNYRCLVIPWNRSLCVQFSRLDLIRWRTSPFTKLSFIFIQNSAIALLLIGQNLLNEKNLKITSNIQK